MGSASATVLHYRTRAEELSRLGDAGIDSDYMEWGQIKKGLNSPDTVRLCANAAGLLYVHAGIAMADALLVLLTGKRSTAQDHRDAVRRLRKSCGQHRKPLEGVDHFSWLVQQKNHFAYDDKRVSLDEAKQAKIKIGNFLTWAFESFPEIAS